VGSAQEKRIDWEKKKKRGDAGTPEAALQPHQTIGKTQKTPPQTKKKKKKNPKKRLFGNGRWGKTYLFSESLLRKGTLLSPLRIMTKGRGPNNLSDTVQKDQHSRRLILRRKEKTLLKVIGGGTGMSGQRKEGVV